MSKVPETAQPKLEYSGSSKDNLVRGGADDPLAHANDHEDWEACKARMGGSKEPKGEMY